MLQGRLARDDFSFRGKFRGPGPAGSDLGTLGGTDDIHIFHIGGHRGGATRTTGSGVDMQRRGGTGRVGDGGHLFHVGIAGNTDAGGIFHDEYSFLIEVDCDSFLKNVI